MNQTQLKEIVSVEFRPEIKLEQQKTAMASLSATLEKYDGFESREYFYSEELNRWTDILTWNDETKAKVASQDMMQQPCAAEVFPLMVEETLIMGYFKQVS